MVGPDKAFVELFARGAGPPANWHAAGDELDLNAAPAPIAHEIKVPTPIYDPAANVWRGVPEVDAEVS